MGIPTDACAQWQRLHRACKSRGVAEGLHVCKGVCNACRVCVCVHSVWCRSTQAACRDCCPQQRGAALIACFQVCLQCGVCASRKRRACVYMRVGVCSTHCLPQEVHTQRYGRVWVGCEELCVLCHTWDVCVHCVSHLWECVRSRTSACCVHTACPGCADTALMVLSVTAAVGLRVGDGWGRAGRGVSVSASDVCSCSAVAALRFQEPIFLQAALQ